MLEKRQSSLLFHSPMSNIDQQLYHACISNQYVNVKNLIEKHGANVNICTGILGSTLIMKTTTPGWTSICRLLVENGADVNIKDYYGMTALHYGATWGRLEIIQLLIERGAELHVCTLRRKNVGDHVFSPLDYARKEKEWKAVRLIQRAIRRQPGESLDPTTHYFINPSLPFAEKVNMCIYFVSIY